MSGLFGTRAWRVWAVGLIAALALPGTAAPGAADARAEALGGAALEMIDYPWEPLGWDIEFKAGRPGLLGLTVGPERRVEIYVRPGHSVTDVAHTVAHELGHVVDIEYGTPYRRREYRRMRGLSTKSRWFGCDGCSDYATPAGDFAEVFEYWLLGGGDYRSQLAPPPSSEDLEYISTLFVAPAEPSVAAFWRQRWRPDS